MLNTIKIVFKKHKKTELNNEKLKKIWLKKNMKEQYQDKIANRKILHQNSVELVNFINAKKIMPLISSIHEIGCGSGRNLGYMQRKINLNGIFLSGNDLSRESCFSYMDNDLKKLITFYEQDTLSFLKNEVKNKKQVDLLLSSDHLMHLGRDIIKNVYFLMSQYTNKFILLREPYGQRVKVTDGFVWAADFFENSFPGFEMVDFLISESSTEKKEFILILFKRKDLTTNGTNQFSCNR